MFYFITLFLLVYLYFTISLCCLFGFPALILTVSFTVYYFHRVVYSFLAGIFTGFLTLALLLLFNLYISFSHFFLIYISLYHFPTLQLLGFQSIVPERPSDILLIALDLFQSFTRAPRPTWVSLGP